MDLHTVVFAKAFLSCTGSIRDIKRVYNALVMNHHPDKGGDKEQFQKLQNVYAIARKGRVGMTELRRALPKRVQLEASASTPHADKLGVFVRDAETVNNKPLYVKKGNANPKTAIWWVPPDVDHPSGIWLLGRYEKRGGDVAYHMKKAHSSSFEEEGPGEWETFFVDSERFEETHIEMTINEA